MKKKNIKLLICYHKKSPLFKDEILTPIHVGRANAKKRLDPNSENYKWLMTNLIGDDTGENISDRNDSYNEMTALYWAWKNYEALGNPDYVGLMHYRRHFVLKENVQAVYNIKDFDSSTYYDILNYSPEKMQELVDGCDFLTHIGKVKNVYNHYIENQRKEDIDLANKIMLEKYPEYKEVMEKYYSGDYSNFCNMNIFSKEIFFEYCEFIFSILEEFENRVDVSEKRFFISERLTGIFMAKLMEDKTKKFKKLPIAFMEEPVDVPIAIKLNDNDSISVATAITSILENSKKYNTYHFYLFCDKNVSDKTKENFKYYSRKYSECIIDFIDSEIEEEYLPSHLSYLLPKVNKCIYLSGHVIAMFDIGEFYRICSTDDYYIVGVPQEKYDAAELNKKIGLELLVLNCRRMRMHNISEEANQEKNKDLDGMELLNHLCKGEIGYIPWYFFTSEKLSSYNGKVIADDKTRGTIQSEACWRPFLIYDGLNPIVNNQGIYSIFWWNMMRKNPLPFQRINENLVVLSTLYADQQKKINIANESHAPARNNNVVEMPVVVPENNEEWRNYGFYGKLKFYYKHNGCKKTISYGMKKIFGRKEK